MRFDLEVKGHVGQSQIIVPNKGRWAHDNVTLLHFSRDLSEFDISFICLQGNVDLALEYLEKGVISFYQVSDQQAKNVDPNLLYW